MLGVAVAACGAPSAPVDDQPADPDAIALYGKNVILYYHPDAVPCAGTLGYLDANVGALGAYFGLPIAAPIPYHYRKDLPCPPEFVGCAIGAPGRPAAAWSTTPDSIHELVHAVQLPHADSVSFLLEAQAVALGEPRFSDGPMGVSDSDLIQPPRIPSVDYPIAGDFASYLLTRFGPAPFERVMEAVPPQTSTDDAEAAFTRVYGESLAQLRADRAAAGEPFVQFPADRIGFAECIALPADEALGAGSAVTESLDCATNGVGTQGGTLMYRQVPFDVAADGVYSLLVQIPPGPQIWAGLQGCGKTSAIVWGNGATSVPATVVAYLPKGRYSVGFTAPPQTAVSFGVAVHPIVLATKPSCATIPVVDIPPGTTQLFVLSMEDGPFEVPFRLAMPALAAPLGGLASTADVCAGGCDQNCVASPKLQPGTTWAVRANIAEPEGYVGFVFN